MIRWPTLTEAIAASAGIPSAAVEASVTPGTTFTWLQQPSEGTSREAAATLTGWPGAEHGAEYRARSPGRPMTSPGPTSPHSSGLGWLALTVADSVTDRSVGTVTWPGAIEQLNEYDATVFGRKMIVRLRTAAFVIAGVPVPSAVSAHTSLNPSNSVTLQSNAPADTAVGTWVRTLPKRSSTRTWSAPKPETTSCGLVETSSWR